MWRLKTPGGILLIIVCVVCLAAYGWYRTQPNPMHPFSKTAPIALPEAQKTPNAAAKNNAANETDRIILSLFDAPVDSEGLALEQTLRTRYRNAYIGIYLLKGCSTNVQTYHLALASAFSKEWARHGKSSPPPADITSMLSAIIEEARSSYTMLYVNTPCENRNLEAFKAYFEKL